MMSRWISGFFKVLALLLSYVMVAVVSMNYGIMVECIRRGGCSAPASVAWIHGLPWLISLLLTLLLWRYYHKKYQVEKKS